MHFKANEVRNFMFYAAEHIFKPFFKGREGYLEFLVELVQLMKELDGTNLRRSRVQAMLVRFATLVLNWQKWFGTEHVGINVHSMLHLVHVVLNWGPLWAYSMWYFESQNKQVLNVTHGTNNKGISATSMYYLKQHIHDCEKNVTGTDAQTLLLKWKSPAFHQRLGMTPIGADLAILIDPSNDQRGTRLRKGRQVITCKTQTPKNTKDYVVAYT